MSLVRRHTFGSSGESGQRGFIYRERIVIDDVAGSTMADVIFNAFNDAGVPAYFQQLSFGVVPDDFITYAAERTVRSVARDGALAQVILEVAWWQYPQIQSTTQTSVPDDNGPGTATVGSIVETVETEFDSAGAEITVKRDANSPDIIQPVQFRRPRPVIDFQRKELSNPRSRALTYVGKLNSSVWNSYSAGTVLCTGIVGRTNDGGVSYEVDYSFEVDPDGWSRVVAFIDENTGRPISPLVDTVSKKTIDLYESISFGGLNISL